VQDERKPAVELVELARLGERAGRLLLGQVARRLPRRRLEQVEILPVKPARRARPPEQEAADQPLVMHQRDDQPGARHQAHRVRHRYVAVGGAVGLVLADIEHPVVVEEEVEEGGIGR